MHHSSALLVSEFPLPLITTSIDQSKRPPSKLSLFQKVLSLLEAEELNDVKSWCCYLKWALVAFRVRLQAFPVYLRWSFLLRHGFCFFINTFHFSDYLNFLAWIKATGQFPLKEESIKSEAWQRNWDEVTFVNPFRLFEAFCWIENIEHKTPEALRS